MVEKCKVLEVLLGEKRDIRWIMNMEPKVTLCLYQARHWNMFSGPNMDVFFSLLKGFFPRGLKR